MRAWRKSQLLAFLGVQVVMLQFLQSVVLAGPVRRSSRMIREVYPEIEPEKLEGNQAEVCIVGDVVYGAEEPVPADQPCLKCKCQPPGVQCETTRCLKKPGCRAIHKPNQCCPEYQCECEHQGRFYANGERLQTPPGGECRVCYCRGGEVQCAEVSCYIRTDCEGRTVPGQCCPKYDHCPPREPLIDRVVPYTTQSPLTNNVQTLAYWNGTAEDQLTTAVYDVHAITNEDSNKITESQTEPTNTPKPPEVEAPKDASQEINKIHIHEIKLVDESTQTDPLEEETPKQTFIQFQDSDDKSTPKNIILETKDAPKITIQEIIPEIKEIPITGPPKREINIRTHGQTLDEAPVFEAGHRAETGTLDRSSIQDKENSAGDLALGDTESDSSEISEIYHHPPPVLKIGDQLLFLKKGELVPGKDLSTPLPVITIIGAEGLQRGTEDSGETHEVVSQVQEPVKEGVSEDPQRNETVTTEGNDSAPTVESHIISFVKPKVRAEDTTKMSLSTIEDFLFNLSKAQPTGADDLYVEKSDLNTSIMTKNIVNKIKTLTNVESTTDVAHLVQRVVIPDVNSTDIDYSGENSSTVNPLTNEQNSSAAEEKWYEAQPVTKDSNDEESVSTSAESVTLLERMESAYIPFSTEENEENSTHSSIRLMTPDTAVSSRYEELGEATKTKHDEETLPIDQNPEYPPIPDIMSPQNVDELSEHLDSELAHVSSEEPLTMQERNPLNSSLTLDTNETGISSPSSDIPTDPPKYSGVIFKILPKYNDGISQNSSKLSHPLVNKQAALPSSLLKQVAPTDKLVDDEATEPHLKDKDLELQLAETKSDEVRASSDEFQPIIKNDEPTQDHSSSTISPSVQMLALNASVAATTESDRSKETLEETSVEDSGESTTPRNRHASVILSVEDASVEALHSGSLELDTTDLVETIPGIQESTEESENRSLERKDEVAKTTMSTPTSSERDVELIDPAILMSDLKIKDNIMAKNVSNENKIQKEDMKVKSSKEVASRLQDNKVEWQDKEADDIFKQLNEELKTAPSYSGKPANEEEEAQAIFRELLEDATSSTQQPDSNTQGVSSAQTPDKESALLQKVSAAITKFQAKESKESLDTSILGIIRDFFSSQYKYYDSKK